MKKLTAKQKIFCDEYSLDYNATRAAISAGYSEKTAYSIGSENLKKPEIKEYLDEIQKDLAKASGISKLRVLNELKSIAFSNISSYFNTWIEKKEFEQLNEVHKSCISEVETKVLKKNIGTKKKPNIVDVEYVKIKLYDKPKAIEIINKMLGFNEPEKIQHSGNIQALLAPFKECKVNE